MNLPESEIFATSCLESINNSKHTEISQCFCDDLTEEARGIPEEMHRIDSQSFDSLSVISVKVRVSIR